MQWLQMQLTVFNFSLTTDDWFLEYPVTILIVSQTSNLKSFSH